MKKLLLILLSYIALASCFTPAVKKEQPPYTPFIYNVGDIVYIKPDSTRAIVTDIGRPSIVDTDTENIYRIGVMYGGSLHYSNVNAYQIFGKKK